MGKESFEINKPIGVSQDWHQEIREAVKRFEQKKLGRNPREFARLAVAKHQEKNYDTGITNNDSSIFS